MTPKGWAAILDKVRFYVKHQRHRDFGYTHDEMVALKDLKLSLNGKPHVLGEAEIAQIIDVIEVLASAED